ncbi:hypothetical protein LSTR_LSTR009110 [Laodelphax striatellus]|uniref:Uncharacterized protein n=1 Tax=Laodelphax striatellus TaxID=195883 RepID=A0A482XQB0_LAOST|nr:hypothetical protein LSTR_LSTR015862 [Laodelphax striatellus]RZF47371.1 hypothetical protein LSTR_LSTR009110 [Laodelphax striatellus]
MTNGCIQPLTQKMIRLVAGCRRGIGSGLLMDQCVGSSGICLPEGSSRKNVQVQWGRGKRGYQRNGFELT